MIGFVSIGEAVILLGIFALLVDRVLEVLGRSRSARTLRAENADLTRRVAQVESAEIRCRSEAATLQQRISDLETALETLRTLRGRRENE